MMSLTTAGERVREMGCTEALMSMAGRSGGPVMVSCMLQGRRTWEGREGREEGGEGGGGGERSGDVMIL
jgi:hypothetical protein